MSSPEFGLPPATLEAIRRILAEVPAVKKAVIYGSRAKGTYRPGSDIDLTLFGDGLDLDTLGRIATRLHESPIPYQVDLSILNSSITPACVSTSSGWGSRFTKPDVPGLSAGCTRRHGHCHAGSACHAPPTPGSVASACCGWPRSA